MIMGTIIKKNSNRHWSLKEKARVLRSKGLSYNEILKKIPASKSSISLWCRDVRLTKKQQKQLGEKRDHSLKGIRAIQQMFWDRRCDAFHAGIEKYKKLKDEKKFIAGLMLYWAEGTKGHSTTITNSDQRIIRFMTRWFKTYFGASPKTLSMHLHIHSGQNEDKMKRYWSGITGIPLANFIKSFVKPEGLGYRKNILYQGTAKVRVKGAGSLYVLYEILGGIAAFLEDMFHEKIEYEKWMVKLPYAE